MRGAALERGFDPVPVRSSSGRSRASLRTDDCVERVGVGDCSSGIACANVGTGVRDGSKSNRSAAGLGATVAGAAVLIAQQAGLFADDAGRVLPKVSRAAGSGGGVVDVLRDPAVSGTLKQAPTTFRDLRRGTEEEIVVARVGCAVMNAGVAGPSTRRSTKSRFVLSSPRSTSKDRSPSSSTGTWPGPLTP